MHQGEFDQFIYIHLQIAIYHYYFIIKSGNLILSTKSRLRLYNKIKYIEGDNTLEKFRINTYGYSSNSFLKMEAILSKKVDNFSIVGYNKYPSD